MKATSKVSISVVAPHHLSSPVFEEQRPARISSSKSKACWEALHVHRRMSAFAVLQSAAKRKAPQTASKFKGPKSSKKLKTSEARALQAVMVMLCISCNWVSTALQAETAAGTRLREMPSLHADAAKGAAGGACQRVPGLCIRPAAGS